MEAKFRNFTSTDSNSIALLMQELQKEDELSKPITFQKAQKTFDAMTAHPDWGNIFVFEYQNEIMGYAIVNNFWSNEYGGIVGEIDEIFIKKEFRSKGIGSAFIAYLANNPLCNYIALQLEVSKENVKARKLYEKLGFAVYKNTSMFLELPDKN